MKMEALYHCVGISRQGFHNYRKNQSHKAQREDQIVQRVRYHRQTHQRMGARPLFAMMHQLEQEDQALVQQFGRDKFEQILLNNDLRVQKIRTFHKTTYSGAFRFPNLVEGLKINQLNRIWVSDITYYRLNQDWAYLTSVLELYSRRLLGYAISQTLQTEHTTIPALKMALKTRKIKDFNNQLIFHSDGGGQYYDAEFLKILQQHSILSSMAEIVYENPHSERFHGTAKNDYLIPWKVNSFEQLKREFPRFVKLYNEIRPHESLKYKTPIDFEKEIQLIPLCQRPLVLFKKIT